MPLVIVHTFDRQSSDVKRIGKYAFRSCTSLTSVNIPITVIITENSQQREIWVKRKANKPLSAIKLSSQ